MYISQHLEADFGIDHVRSSGMPTFPILRLEFLLNSQGTVVILPCLSLLFLGEEMIYLIRPNLYFTVDAEHPCIHLLRFFVDSDVLWSIALEHLEELKFLLTFPARARRCSTKERHCCNASEEQQAQLRGKLEYQTTIKYQ